MRLEPDGEDAGSAGWLYVDVTAELSMNKGAGLYVAAAGCVVFTEEIAQVKYELHTSVGEDPLTASIGACRRFESPIAFYIWREMWMWSVGFIGHDALEPVSGSSIYKFVHPWPVEGVKSLGLNITGLGIFQS